jgi:hypothetical protein
MRIHTPVLLILCACAGRPHSAADTIHDYSSYDHRSLDPALSPVAYE